MTLRAKIAKVVGECGCQPLPTKAHSALVKLIEAECAECVRQASVQKPVGKLLHDFAAFLNRKGFEIVDPESVRQEVSDSYHQARQIFKNRDVLVPFMCGVAVNARDGKPFKYSVSSPGEANVLKNFLDALRKSGRSLSYDVDGNDFTLELPADEAKCRFFRSEWAEGCFRHVISKIVGEASKKFKVGHRIIQNIKIRRKGENSLFSEFDIVVQLDSRFYVFEVKSGPWIRIKQWAARENAFVTDDGPLRVIVCTIHENIPCEIFKPQILMNLGNIQNLLPDLFAKDLTDAQGQTVRANSKRKGS